MKKLISAIVALAMIFSMIPTAFAESYSEVYGGEATTLNTLGVFAGTENGFELDRVSTRMEACVMLVRLLGKESEANAVTETLHPFTDIPQWAEKYASWLYENGIVAGTSETTFSPSDNCTLQMYSTFVLRALGYSDVAGDFSYSGAIETGYAKGINDIICENAPLYRGMLAHMSYNAIMACSMKDGTSLAKKLIEANVFTQDNFANVYATCENMVSSYLDEISALSNADTSHVSITGTMKATTTTANGSATQLMNMSVKCKTDSDGNISYLTEVEKQDDQYLHSNSQYENGYVYSDTTLVQGQANVSFRNKMPIDFELVADTLDSRMNIIDTSDFEGATYVTKHISNDETYYTVNLDGDISAVEAVGDMFGDPDMFGDNAVVRITYAVKNNSIVRVGITVCAKSDDLAIESFSDFSVDTVTDFTIEPVANPESYELIDVSDFLGE